jgi:hypothetical protein
MAWVIMIKAPEVNCMDIIARLIEQLAAEDELVRVQAGEFLIQMGSAAVRPLIETLQNPNYPARPLVASTLGQIGDRRAVEPLIQALKDHDKLVRYHAALALGKLKDKRAVKPLIYALFDEMPPIGPDPLTGDPMTVRAAAAQALGELKAAEAVPALKVLLRDENRGVRRAVIQALGQIGTKEAIVALSEAVWDEQDEDLQELMVRFIARHPFHQAFDTLKQIAQSHPRERLRQIAKNFLDEVETPLAPPTPLQDEQKVQRKPFRFLSGTVAAVLIAGLFHLGWKHNRYATLVASGVISVVTFGIWKYRRRNRPKQNQTLDMPLQPSTPSRSETA